MGLSVVPCPLCGQSNLFIDITVPDTDAQIRTYGSLYAGKTISEWKICGQCGFVHQNPRPSVEALNEFYKQSQYHSTVVESDGVEHLKFARWYFSEKIEFALKHSQLSPGRVFDIGSGRGGVLKLFEERGWKSYGVEPDERLAAFATNVMGLSGVQQCILDSNFVLEKKVDLIFTNHAFEHFADLDGVMKGVLNILRPGGYLFIAVPTYFKNKSSLSKDWMNSGHYSLFTHSSLSNLLSKYGLDEVAHTYSGWNKEVDDLWYLAKFAGKMNDPKVFFENPENVSRYLHVINPIRSIFFYPVYSHWALRVQIFNAFKLLLTSPADFFKKVAVRIKRFF